MFFKLFVIFKYLLEFHIPQKTISNHAVYLLNKTKIKEIFYGDKICFYINGQKQTDLKQDGVIYIRNKCGLNLHKNILNKHTLSSSICISAILQMNHDSCPGSLGFFPRWRMSKMVAFKIPNPGGASVSQNPETWNTYCSQIPWGCPPSPPRGKNIDRCSNAHRDIRIFSFEVDAAVSLGDIVQ